MISINGNNIIITEGIEEYVNHFKYTESSKLKFLFYKIFIIIIIYLEYFKFFLPYNL